MTHDTIPSAAADAPYAALNQHLHGDGDVPPLRITYRNWRGEVGERNIIPHSVWFGATEWHPEPQWLLSALDTDKGAARDFALADFGANDDTWRARALSAEAEVERLRGALEPSVKALQVAKRELWDLQRGYWTKDDFLNHAAVQMITGALCVARAALAEGGPDDR